MAKAIQEDISAGKAMVKTGLPAWVLQCDGVYKGHNAYSPGDNRMKPRSELPVYQRQLLQNVLFGEKRDERKSATRFALGRANQSVMATTASGARQAKLPSAAKPVVAAQQSDSQCSITRDDSVCAHRHRSRQG